MLSRRLLSIVALLSATATFAFTFRSLDVTEDHFPQAYPAIDVAIFPLLQGEDGDTVVLDFTQGDFSDEIGGVFHYNEPKLPSGAKLGPILSGHTVSDFSMQLVFDFDNQTVSGNLHADATMIDSGKAEESGSSTIDGQLSDGWLEWSPEDNVWVFGGTFNLSASIHEVRSKRDTDGVILYEDINLQFDAPAEFEGASGDSDDPDIWPHIDIRYEKMDLNGFSLGSHSATSIHIGFYDNSIDFSGFPGQEGAAESLSVVESSSDDVQESEAPKTPRLIDEDLHARIVDFLQWGTGDIESIKSHSEWPRLEFSQQNSLEDLMIEVEAIRLAQIPEDELNALLAAVDAAANALGPEGQKLYDAMRLRQLKEDRNAQVLMDELEREVEAWNRIEFVTNRERIRGLGGSQGDTLVWIVDNTGIIKGVVDEVSSWVGWLTDPKAAAQSAAEDYLKEEANITSIEEAVDKTLVLMSKSANSVVVKHYTYYYQEYMKLDDSLSIDERHTQALEILRERFLAPPDSAIKTSKGADKLWRDSYAKDTEPGELYDRAFKRLGGLKPPGKVE